MFKGGIVMPKQINHDQLLGALSYLGFPKHFKVTLHQNALEHSPHKEFTACFDFTFTIERYEEDNPLKDLRNQVDEIFSVLLKSDPIKKVLNAKDEIINTKTKMIDELEEEIEELIIFKNYYDKAKETNNGIIQNKFRNRKQRRSKSATEDNSNSN